MGHLKKGSSGHLLKSVNGHLVTECGGGYCDCGFLGWFSPVFVSSKTWDYVVETGANSSPCPYYYVGFFGRPTATDINGSALRWWLNVSSRPFYFVGRCLWIRSSSGSAVVDGSNTLVTITTTLTYTPSVVPDPVTGLAGNRSLWQFYTQATAQPGLTLFLLSAHGFSFYGDPDECVDPTSITQWNVLYNDIKPYADSVGSVNTTYMTEPDVYAYATDTVVNPAGAQLVIDPVYSSKDPTIHPSPC